jgi:hypothetical protein
MTTTNDTPAVRAIRRYGRDVIVLAMLHAWKEDRNVILSRDIRWVLQRQKVVRDGD